MPTKSRTPTLDTALGWDVLDWPCHESQVSYDINAVTWLGGLGVRAVGRTFSAFSDTPPRLPHPPPDLLALVPLR